jgi:hypothetical protein
MRRNERGIALITALFALLLLTGIGLGLLYMSDAETMINANYRDSQQAYFAAMAGLQEVRQRMTPSAADVIAVPTVTPGNNNSYLYLINPAGGGDTVDPQNSTNGYYDNQLCNEYGTVTGGKACPGKNSPTFMAYVNDDTPGIANTAKALPYKWVRIEQKVNGTNAPYYNQTKATNGTATATTPICWNGVNEFPLTETTDPSCSQGPGSDPPGHTPVYVLTGYATTNNASRYAQMEVAMDPPIETHGAVDSADHVTLNGQLTVNGYDYCTCQCTTAKTGTTCGNPSNPKGYYSATCDTTHYAIYSASTVDNPNNSETVIAGTTPAIDQNQSWPWNVQALYQKYAAAPGAVNVTGPPYNWNCSSGCGTQDGVALGTLPTIFPPSPPTNTNGMTSQITVVPSDLKITNDASEGAGVLVVNGNLDINGGFQYFGLIIVTGTITFSGGGSHPANITGAIIAGQHSVTNLDNTFGGGVNINFDYCALPGGNTNQPPRSLALRDINF